jgi:hypothetical protein
MEGFAEKESRQKAYTTAPKYHSEFSDAYAPHRTLEYLVHRDDPSPAENIEPFLRVLEGTIYEYPVRAQFGIGMRPRDQTEIAKELGVNKKCVSARVCKGLKLIREKVAGEGGEGGKVAACLCSSSRGRLPREPSSTWPGPSMTGGTRSWGKYSFPQESETTHRIGGGYWEAEEREGEAQAWLARYPQEEMGCRPLLRYRGTSYRVSNYPNNLIEHFKDFPKVEELYG